MQISNHTHISTVKSQSDKETEKLKSACQDFESVFLSQLMKSMRSTVPKSDLFGDGSEQQMFQEMMDQEICKSAAKTQGIGLADVLFNQFNQQFGAKR
jgi:flagellar protein FlgJ